MVSWCYHQAEYLSLFKDYEIVAMCLSAYLTFALAQFWGFVWDRVPLLPSVHAGKGLRTLALFVGYLFFGSSMWSALCPCGAPSWFSLMVDVPVVHARCW